MKKTFLLITLLLLFTPVFSQNCVHMVFFYSNGCSHCAEAEEYLDSLEEEYPYIVIDRRSIQESGNAQLFMAYLENYDVSEDLWGYVPGLFIHNQAYIGADSIIENVEQDIIYCTENDCLCSFNQELAEQFDARPFPEENSSSVITGGMVHPKSPIKLTLAAITISALVDSINPCAFAVIIFLLTYLITLGARKRIFKIGLTYTLTVFLTYFLSGLGLFVAVQSTGMTRIVYFGAAIIALIAGVINVKDYFWYGKGITLRIPKKAKPSIKKWVHKSSLPAAVILGFLVSLFELPCTGGVYLAILGLLSNNMTQLQAIPSLLWYNFIFVLPLLIIVLIVGFGVSTDKLEKWRKNKRKHMKLFSGLLMIGLGVLMLGGWV